MTMSGTARFTDSHDAVSERAASFFARRRFGPWEAADQSELEAWLAESTSHYVAWLRVEGIAARTDHLATVHSFRAVAKPNDAAPAAPRKLFSRRIMLPLLAAASVALFAAFGIPLWNSLMQVPDHIYSTEIGGRTSLKFSDGTEVALNTDTVARFRMTNEERTVWLDKGEAWFRVAHDAAHPFAVVIGRHRVTDLGTEFLVRRNPAGVEVALLTGRATLSTEGAPVATLEPGEDVVATRVSMTVTHKSQQELEDELAWRNGMLVFRNARFADAVKEFNRYNQTKLVIADPSVADMKFTVEIRNDNFEGFLHLAETMLNLRADRQGNDILLSRETSEKTKRSMRAKQGR